MVYRTLAGDQASTRLARWRNTALTALRIALAAGLRNPGYGRWIGPNRSAVSERLGGATSKGFLGDGFVILTSCYPYSWYDPRTLIYATGS